MRKLSLQRNFDTQIYFTILTRKSIIRLRLSLYFKEFKGVQHLNVAVDLAQTFQLCPIDCPLLGTQTLESPKVSKKVLSPKD